MRRVARWFGFFFLLVFAGNVIGFLFGSDRWEGPPGQEPDGPNFGFIVFILLAIGGVMVFRTVRRTAAPIGDVMEAANRVAAGDYAARVKAKASGEVGNLVTSFNEMAGRLQTNEEQRRALLADVAHELRTPLSVIRGTVEGMLDGVYPRDDAHLAPVLDETAHMARLLDDLRTLSLAEAGALRLHREPTDAAELIDDVAAAFAPRASQRQIELTATVAPLPTLEIDPVRVREVLENLLSNAVRHTPPGGRIRVDAVRSDGLAVFTVADSGAGIPPDQLPHVFDRFTKSADSGGSGLGLAIVKNLVEAHGGTIGAESAPGRGTTMRFTLPVG